MDAEFVRELFARFGAVSVNRMFGGAGIWSGGLMFALEFDGVIYLRVDDASIGDFEREGSKPFVYPRAKTPGKVGRPSRAFWRLPERLYDDPRACDLGAARGCDRRTKKTQAAQADDAAADKAGRGKKQKPPLKRRVGFACAPKRKALLFQVELAFDAAARFVGDLSLLQQPVDVFALGADQIRA
jgi:DNA transformation protein